MGAEILDRKNAQVVKEIDKLQPSSEMGMVLDCQNLLMDINLIWLRLYLINYQNNQVYKEKACPLSWMVYCTQVLSVK